MIIGRHRRITSAILAATALGVLPATGRGARDAPHPHRSVRVVIGRSVRGRPIVAWAYGPSSGEETAWSNHALPGTTSFVVELPAGPVGRTALARHLRAIRAVELGGRAGSPHRCDSSTIAQ